ncbi:MAG: DUF6174 domain-containing protein [Gemmatimonadota bacterium]
MLNATSRTLLAGVLLAGPACSTDPSDDLIGARQRWASQHISTYVITVSKSCECLGPWKIDVHIQNGAVVSMVDPATGQQLPVPFSGPYQDVEGLFTTVEAAIQQHAHSLTVRYNRTYGYPESISIDWNPKAVDDEIAYAVTDFQPG